MAKSSQLQQGYYEHVITDEVRRGIGLAITQRPDLMAISGVPDPDRWIDELIGHVSRAVSYRLRQLTDQDLPTEEFMKQSLVLVNDLVEQILGQGDAATDLYVSEPAAFLEAFLPKQLFAIGNDDKQILETIRLQKPLYGLGQSQLFSGGRSEVSLEHELRREIKTADRIDLLVSFIKFSGLRLLLDDLRDFAQRGGQIRAITTTYMGATDERACDLLAGITGAELKINYNSKIDRLHAKAYIFWRNSGMHTAYVGSSNISMAAITKGLEWNVKLTAKDNSLIINKVNGAFETYWQDIDFEPFVKDDFHKSKLRRALKKERATGDSELKTFFDFEPKPYQQEVLNKLIVERQLHGRYRNLVVAATGTGKTFMAGFDFKSFKSSNPAARLLFLAHRIEILKQSLDTFRQLLRDGNFGELWDANNKPTQFEHLFVSVATLKNHFTELIASRGADYYDYIIVDEVHHGAAESYRPIFNDFKPKILLGLTATPERADNVSIVPDFDNHIATEIRLPEAINNGYLSSFHYYCITDYAGVDYSRVSWSKGKYAVDELMNLYTSVAKQRVDTIIRGINEYVTDPLQARAIGFCVSIEHAEQMAEYFTEAGFNAEVVTSATNDEDRRKVKQRLESGPLFVFTVDLYNEGVDIPAVDTVLFLRPTESATVFLQQLGRGLRLMEGKDCLTVLDFIAQVNQEFNYEQRFRSLIGRTATSIADEIENDFPSVPNGCHIRMEKVAKEYILNNIRRATIKNRSDLVHKVRSFANNTTKPLTLYNFTQDAGINHRLIYQRIGSWSELLIEAKLKATMAISSTVEQAGSLCNLDSPRYLAFIRQIIHARQSINQLHHIISNEPLLAVMLHHDLRNQDKRFQNVFESLSDLVKDEVLCDELINLLECCDEEIREVPDEVEWYPDFQLPLELHAAYSIKQIITAFGYKEFNSAKFMNQGVLSLKNRQTELFFITLNKSEGSYSSTTMYKDYAISETLFHWESQNDTGPTTETGQRYINHQKSGVKLMLFVRESKKDAYGKTCPYTCLGFADYVSHEGSKPMQIKLKLHKPIPPILLQHALKYTPN